MNGINLPLVMQRATLRGRTWARDTFRHQLAAGILRPAMVFQSAPSVAAIAANGQDAQGDQTVVDLLALATIAGAAREWAQLNADLLVDISLPAGAGKSAWDCHVATAKGKASLTLLGTVYARSTAGAWWEARQRWPERARAADGYRFGQVVVKRVAR